MPHPTDSFSSRPLGSPDAGLFAERPLPAAPQTSAEPAPPPSRKPRPTRWLVPLVVLLVIIGGIAWLVQNMPTRGQRNSAPPVGSGELLRPGINKEPTEKDDPTVHIPEFEKGEEGKRLYPFQNATSESVELFLYKTSCDCSRMDVCLVDQADWDKVRATLEADFNAVVPEDPSWPWQPLKQGDHPVTIPPSAHALLKMSWVARKEPGSTLNLEAALFARSPSKRQKHGVTAAAVIRHALEMQPDRAMIGILDPGTSSRGEAKFVFWSATRDQAEFRIEDAHRDGLVTIPAPRVLDAGERAKLQKDLLFQKINTKVRCAFEVNLTIHEQKGSSQLDQGPLYRALNVEMENNAAGLPPLLLIGMVRGDVQVGAADDQGKVKLGSFRAAEGTRKEVSIWPDLNTTVQIGKFPGALDVKLTETKERTATRKKWLLEVTVPPGAHFGPFDEEHVIILDVLKEDAPNRRIRIPIAGNAAQG